MGKFIDLTGMRFGRLVVLKRDYSTKKGVKWICQCDCGNITTVATTPLKNGHTQSCGCLQKEKAGSRFYKDLTGLTFGRLKVLRKAPSTKHGKSSFVCQCDCGNIVTVKGQRLIRGITKSCGCLRKDTAKTLKISHGMTGTRIYKCWKNMLQRCNNPKIAEYKNYGGRGISVCNDWATFQNFYDWAIQSGYRDDLTIDRIDVNKNYCPENCRWADRYTQARNRTDNIFITINGKTMVQKDWAKELNISPATLNKWYKKAQHAGTQTLITPKGRETFRLLMEAEGLIDMPDDAEDMADAG